MLDCAWFVISHYLFSGLCLPLYVAAEATLSQRDMAEELSRQLEDILSTYCRENISDDASTVPNGQSHNLQFNGLSNVREDEKQDQCKVNGGDSGVEKEQKKTQEKKKVKGLGKKNYVAF